MPLNTAVLVLLLSLIGCTTSRNPPNSLAPNQPGLLILRALVIATGTAERITVLKTSGNVEQDALAKEAVSKWKFVPALDAEKRPVAEWVRIPIKFEQGTASKAED